MKKSIFMGALVAPLFIISCGGAATEENSDEKTTEEKTELVALGACPSETKLVLDWNKEAQDFYKSEWALNLNASSKALCSFNKKGSTIQIFYPVGDLKTKDIADPMEMKSITEGQGFLKMTFKLKSKEMPSIGEYEASYGAEKEVYFGIKSTREGKPWFHSFGDNSGTAKIIDIKDGKICGEFSFSGSNGAATTSFTGSFVCDIEEFENY
jgi:hypothetical protein